MAGERGWFDYLTGAPDPVRKKAAELRAQVEPNSVFDPKLERTGKDLLRGGITLASEEINPVNALTLGMGGAGFAGAKIANRLRILPKVSDLSHYTDAVRLGKTHEEALKIASSGGRTAADRARMRTALESHFGKVTPRAAAAAEEVRIPRGPNGPVRRAPQNADPNFNQGMGNPELAGSAGYKRVGSDMGDAEYRRRLEKLKADMLDDMEAMRSGKQTRGGW